MKSALTTFTKNMAVIRTDMNYFNLSLDMHLALIDVESLFCTK